MIEKPMDVLLQYPVRKSRRQKKAFRADAVSFFEAAGYSCKEEKGSLGSVNLVVGDPQSAEFLITAHYDTCARLPFPNLITPNSMTLFLAYQLLLSVVILLPGIAAAAVILWLTESIQTAYLAWLLLTVASIYLIMAGPANPTNANDNTSGVVAVMETAASLPEALRDKVCFVLFDLEEAGLFGSAAYQSKHKKETKHQIVLNMDCVGEGDDIYFFVTGKLKKKKEKLQRILCAEGEYDGKNVVIPQKGLHVYPSDQSNFPYGVGICALCQSKVGPYLSRIHTPKDTVLDEKNINTLRNCLLKIVGNAAAE